LKMNQLQTVMNEFDNCGLTDEAVKLIDTLFKNISKEVDPIFIRMSNEKISEKMKKDMLDQHKNKIYF